jgi:hypothetical protein
VQISINIQHQRGSMASSESEDDRDPTSSSDRLPLQVKL